MIGAGYETSHFLLLFYLWGYPCLESDHRLPSPGQGQLLQNRFSSMCYYFFLPHTILYRTLLQKPLQNPRYKNIFSSKLIFAFYHCDIWPHFFCKCCWLVFFLMWSWSRMKCWGWNPGTPQLEGIPSTAKAHLAPSSFFGNINLISFCYLLVRESSRLSCSLSKHLFSWTIDK